MDIRRENKEDMKVVILAGGQPSTISNEGEGIPKPMAQIGERPILWHVMKEFACYGFDEFVICAGYKSEMIKDYFADFYLYNSDITVDLSNNTIEIHKNISENWKVTIIDTGLYSATGERIARIKKYITEENFIVTYGDCLSDISIHELVQAHQQAKKLATMTITRPTGRNKLLSIDDAKNMLIKDLASAECNNAWTDANVYVFNRQIFKYLQGNYSLEDQLFRELIKREQFHIYKHIGFWTPVETVRDKTKMESLWNAGMAPWKKWE